MAILHKIVHHGCWPVVTNVSLFTTAKEKNADLEDLVDDFVTFFAAGMYTSKCLHVYPETAYSSDC